MMKYFCSVIVLGFFSFLFLGSSSESIDKKEVTLSATVSNCGGQLGIYKFDGIGFVLIKKNTEIEKDKYTFSLPAGDPQIFYLGSESAQKLPIVVGTEEAIELTADCLTIRKAVFTKSDFNLKYNKVIKEIQAQKARRNQLMRQVQKSHKFPDMMKKAIEAVNKFEFEKGVYIDSMMGEDPFLGKLAAINSYQSYLVNKKNYPNEIEHYGKDYFASVPLEDPVYNELTFLFAAYREYTGTLAKIRLKEEQVNQYLEHSLQRFNPKSAAYKNALGGIILALQAANHSSFLKFGQLYLDKYKSENTAHVNKMAEALKNASTLMAGGVAPNLTGKTPTGETINLHDLKGKYVLIDFWASWCGPCRKENPHVVKLYDQYKDQGFEIFGVSLDRDKPRWVKAIADDGITWPQISDLKGWQSSHAAIYGVRSVPTTVLLDQEGKIIARNLRSAQLAHELKKIFNQ